MSVNKKVIKVEDLRVYFHTKKGDSKAVDGTHFTMYENETLAIVGESGCGKSVTAMSILGLVSEPGEIMPGSKIVYMGNVDRDEDGLNLATATDEQIRHIRGNEISMIFQEPMSSLNPVITVGDQIMENILTHEEVSKEELINGLSLYLTQKVNELNIDFFAFNNRGHDIVNYIKKERLNIIVYLKK